MKAPTYRSFAFRRRFAAYGADRQPRIESHSNMNTSLLTISKSPCVLMPPAPLQARIPRPHSDDDETTMTVLEDICRLHLAAFVSLRGLPPEAVAYQLVRTGKVGALRPAYAFTLAGPSSPRAQAWLTAVQDGLDTWMQAGWANPIVTERCGAEVLWWTAPLEEAALEAAARLKILCRTEALANLAAYLPEGLAMGHGASRPTPSSRKMATGPSAWRPSCGRRRRTCGASRSLQG